MKLIKDKVFIRITKDSRDSIFSKEITRNDGSKVRLWTNVEAMDNDDRRFTLSVQTGIVEAIADNVYGVKVGDVAIVDYKLCNMDDRIVYKDGGDVVYWLEAKTVYHDEDLIAYANRKSPKDQIAYLKGDYDEVSMLLGLVRDDKVYAREPYVFLEHRSNTISKVSSTGILYSQTERNYLRKVLSSSEESQKNYNIFPGNTIQVCDVDVFTVMIGERSFDCVCDADVLLFENSNNSLSLVP
jgi:hypothetical protein